jgi:hypothetical protein
MADRANRPGGDRWPGGRCGHTGPGLRCGRSCTRRPNWSRRTGRPACRQQLALLLDHRVPGPEGESEGHPGLGRPGETRCVGDHAQSEDLRAGRAGTTWPPGNSPSARRDGDEAQAQELSPASSRTCRCWIPAPAVHHHLCTARHRRCVHLVGKRGLPRAEGVRPRPLRDHRALGQHPGRTVRWRWWTRWWTDAAPARSPRPT